MIENKIGDLFSVSHGHIVHQCNARGAFGSGVALVVRNKYPSAYQNYISHYKSYGLSLGTVISVQVTPTLVIHNAIGQQNYGYDGKLYTNYDALDTCMKTIERYINERNDIEKTLHFPLIGCDRGGGKWEIVSQIIDTNISCNKILWTLK